MSSFCFNNSGGPPGSFATNLYTTGTLRHFLIRDDQRLNSLHQRGRHLRDNIRVPASSDLFVQREHCNAAEPQG